MDLQKDYSFFSTVVAYNSPENLSEVFSSDAHKAITAFHDKYKTLPTKIIVYRGGVDDHDGDDANIEYVKDLEVANLKKILMGVYQKTGYPLELAFIVVSKKTPTRIFESAGNPSCGTVVDSTITSDKR